MAKIIDFSQYRQEEPDFDSMSREQLLAVLEETQAKIAALDEREPKNMESEAYEQWGELHEELEDLADEILDRLEDME